MIRFEPYYQAALWGGHHFADKFGRVVPAKGPIGESWELCELPARTSCAGSLPFAGEDLGKLWRQGALGGSATGRFPFLLKWIDAAERLSVQVHPDAATCAALGHGEPKTEAWYVALSDPKAVLLAGHFPGLDVATLRQAVSGGTVQKWLYEMRVRQGDMLLLPAGTLHALGGGLLLLEVQQPSETTFRLYDWNRLGPDGRPRELHVEQAAAAVHYSRWGAPKIERQKVTGPTFEMCAVARGAAVHGPQSLRVFVADGGAVQLETARGSVALNFGDVVVAEPADGVVRVLSGSVVLIGEPGCGNWAS